PGQPADGRSGNQGHAVAWRRRLGTRLLPQIPEQARRIPRRILEDHQLEQGGRTLRGRKKINYLPTPPLPPGLAIFGASTTEYEKTARLPRTNGPHHPKRLQGPRKKDHGLCGQRNQGRRYETTYHGVGWDDPS